MPFTITVINPCDNPVELNESASLENQEYTITEGAVTYQVPKFEVDPPFCAISYSYEVSDVTVEQVISFDTDPDVRTFTFSNQVDLTLAGDVSTNYLITAKAYTGTVNINALDVSSLFTLTLKNPCIDPSFV